ncbi:MAG: PAS domain S-box protein [Nitrospirae bacterium]|nr:PAS domain S-box protein [Nitrospirota bacterium]
MSDPGSPLLSRPTAPLFQRERLQNMFFAVSVRVVIAAVFLGSYVLAAYFGLGKPPWWARLVPYLYAGYAAGLTYALHLLRKGRSPAPGFHAFCYVVDAFAITVFVFYTGGMYSPFLLIYLLAFLVASMLERARLAVLVGVSQGVLFFGMALGQVLGWVPIHSEAILRADARVGVFLLITCFLGVVDFLVIYLFRRIKISEEEGNKQYQKLGTLYSLTQSLLGRLSLDEQMERVCETVVHALKFEFTAIFLYEEERDALVLSMSAPKGYREWLEAAVGGPLRRFSYPLQQPDRPFIEAIRKKQFYVSRDLREMMEAIDPKIPEGTFEAVAQGIGARFIYQVPLVHQDKLIGLLSSIGGEVALSTEDRDTLLSYADAASLAVADAKMWSDLQSSRNDLERSLEELWIANDKLKASYEQIREQASDLERSRREVEASEKEIESSHLRLERKHRYLQSAVDISQNLHSLTDPGRLAHDFAKLLKKSFPVTQAAIYIRSEETIEPRAAAGFPEGSLRPLTTAELRKEIVWKAIQDRTLIQASVPAWKRAFPVLDKTVAFAAVPLLSGAEWLGFFYFESGVSKPFDEDDTSMQVLLANQFTLALKNSLHFEEAMFYRNYLENLIEHAGAIFLVLDRRSRIQLFNRYAEVKSGYRREEVIGRLAARLFVSADKREDYFRRMSELVRSRVLTSFQGEFRTKSGRVRKTQFTLIPVVNAKGEVEQSILMGEDITDLKNLERQLVETGRMAALGQLAAAVAHDLNNPLSVMSAQMQLLARELSADEGKMAQRVRKAQTATEHIRMLIDNLMGYAKPGRERRIRLSLNDVIREALSFSEYEIRRGGVKVVCQLDEELPRIAAVKGEIQQIVLNLLVNANRAIREVSFREGRNNHRGEIRIETRLLEDGQVALVVSDNGIGIPAQMQEKIFEPFFTTWSNKEGTGLGLAAVRRIVERHSGRISVRGADPKGAEFEILLPVNPPEERV